MILESLVTTVDAAGQVNLAPMGPHVDEGQTSFVLKPFATSRTHANLRATGLAVVHVTDDSALIARAAIDEVRTLPPLRPARTAGCFVLEDCCRWFVLRVLRWEGTVERPAAICEVIEHGSERDFWGFCRAKHAVLEAAILATRVHLFDRVELKSELARLLPLVEKTGGVAEREAFAMLGRYIDAWQPKERP